MPPNAQPNSPTMLSRPPIRPTAATPGFEFFNDNAIDYLEFSVVVWGGLAGQSRQSGRRLQSVLQGLAVISVSIDQDENAKRWISPSGITCQSRRHIGEQRLFRSMIYDL